MRIIMLGAPGAGKGTQAAMLCERSHIPHISTGDILRNAAAAGTDLGKQAQGFMERGELVPDHLMLSLIRDRLQQEDCADGFLLDGFPRTLNQAEALATVFQELNLSDVKVLELTVPSELLLERIEHRGTQGSGRVDDSLEVAKRRLEVYQEKTAPVSDYYRQQGLLMQIDGVGTIEEIRDRVISQLG